MACHAAWIGEMHSANEAIIPERRSETGSGQGEAELERLQKVSCRAGTDRAAVTLSNDYQTMQP
jgi:hypothetical protein